MADFPLTRLVLITSYLWSRFNTLLDGLFLLNLASDGYTSYLSFSMNCVERLAKTAFKTMDQPKIVPSSTTPIADDQDAEDAESTTVASLEDDIEPTEVSSILEELETVKNIVSAAHLRQLRQESKLTSLLEGNISIPTGLDNVKQELAARMGDVWKELHMATVDKLVDAEAYYNTGVNRDLAKLRLTQAVESVLSASLKAPLCEFIRKSSNKSMSFRFSQPRGIENFREGRVKKLSFGEWADIFEGLGEKRQGLVALSRDEFGDFLTNQYGDSSIANVRQLAGTLREIGKRRGGAAHYQEVEIGHEQEAQDLDRLRELILGSDNNSVIKDIVQIFRPISAQQPED